ncbi:MAG TPA: nicotinate-nucleotide--dimethylbenzimidazole phosphoribosyltransferase [Bacteroidia bacterium]|jgi:nicotinate-nucleotide--dimethylbenzimidazole phosphoribosyltransferase|nr:nicotinate-nucleotide--dimethylbenzimidazole phosphoribosyltransferase [Bacteroidia bacterium]
MAQKLFSEEEAKILEEIIFHRRDVRGNRFLQTPVEDNIVEKILLAALNAPSVGFSQPWEFVIVKDKEVKEKVRDSFNEENHIATDLFDKERAGEYAKMKLEGIMEAPLNIAVFYKPSKSTVLGQTTMKEVGLYSVVCAVQNMWLMARAHNVGMGWVSILNPDKVKQILNAPADNKLVAYLCVGYVKEFLERPELEILQWEKRKILEDIIYHERYIAEPLKSFDIKPVSKHIEADIQHKIDFKTKPLGALGQLEKIALKIGQIQNTLSPELRNPHIIVFAADHGIAKDGVSAYPQEVTFQMVMNFLNGGAAINVFCRQNNISIKVVDAGVNFSFPPGLNVVNAKIGMGTKSFLREPAMTIAEAQKAINSGAAIVEDIYKDGCNIIGFGEMGIGNTSSASVLMSLLCNIPIKDCVGKGTGLTTEGLEKKIEILSSALKKHGKPDDIIKVLATYGGFEIAQMCGAILQAAENKMVIMVDGFIATAAFLVAYNINPLVMDYSIFCHQSEENGHGRMLKHLNATPLLDIGMRLGEGTGAAVAYPLIKSSVYFLNHMASFESAGVSNKE